MTAAVENEARLSERLWRNPPLFALVLLGSGWWLHHATGNPWPISLLWLKPFAVLCGVLAALLAVWAFVCFRMKRTPWEPTDLPCALVSNGPFRFSRNPAYLSLLLLLIGALFWTLDFLMLLPPLLYFLGMNWIQIPYEERRLRAQFGAAFDNYCATTRRWI